MLRAPWETSLRCHGALGVPPATLRRVCCDATATCFRGDLIALVLSMFKTWRRPRRPWRPYCDLQRCHGALWDITTTQRRSAAIWPIFADRSEVAVLCDWGINQWWVIVNWTLSNKLQWNLNKLFIQENTSENIISETVTILSRGRWVKG